MFKSTDWLQAKYKNAQDRLYVSLGCELQQPAARQELFACVNDQTCPGLPFTQCALHKAFLKVGVQNLFSECLLKKGFKRSSEKSEATAEMCIID